MSYESSSAPFSRRADAITSSMTAPFLDWMLTMQRQVLSMQQQAMSFYSLPASFARGAMTASNGLKAAHTATRNEEVVALGRETLNVETRVVNQGTTRVHRFVVETPVEEKVSLRQERVIVERRRPVAVSNTGDTLIEKTIEMSDTNEVPVVWTKVELAEEVVLRREVNERVESVRGVLRHDEVEIEEIGHDQAHALAPRPQTANQPAAAQPAARADAPATAAKTQALLAEAKATFGGHETKPNGESKPAAETKAHAGHANEAHRSGKN